MYFVTLAGRNYNIAISVRAALGGIRAVFESRLEACTGPLFSIDCDVDIAYYYEDVASNAGYRSLTLLSGSNSVSEIPTGNALTTLYISILTGSGCTAYNQVSDCPGALPTTTTTTTTSTTTTTTTVAPASYSDLAIKFDQYSSSYNSGTSTWTNIGTSGSSYNLFKSIGAINSGGSGTAVFLGMTGSLSGEETLIPAMYGDFINLYDKSFSYAVIFRVESLTLGYTLSSISAINSSCGFDILGGSDSFGTFIRPYIVKDNNTYGPIIRISSTPKWYLGVLTFDKAGGSNSTKFYLNTSIINFSGGNEIPSPSTFFINSNYNHFLGTTLNPIKIAASGFWQNTVLTQAQVQSLFNEYNSRYTLG